MNWVWCLCMFPFHVHLYYIISYKMYNVQSHIIELVGDLRNNSWGCEVPLSGLQYIKPLKIKAIISKCCYPCFSSLFIRPCVHLFDWCTTPSVVPPAWISKTSQWLLSPSSKILSYAQWPVSMWHRHHPFIPTINQLFIAVVKPHKPVVSSTIARYVDQGCIEEYIVDWIFRNSLFILQDEHQPQ